MVEKMAAGRHCAAQRLKIEFERMRLALKCDFQTSKPTPSNTPPTSPHLLLLPKQLANREPTIQICESLEPFSFIPQETLIRLQDKSAFIIECLVAD